jgi:hypothetical protein
MKKKSEDISWEVEGSPKSASKETTYVEKL